MLEKETRMISCHPRLSSTNNPRVPVSFPALSQFIFFLLFRGVSLFFPSSNHSVLVVPFCTRHFSFLVLSISPTVLSPSLSSMVLLFPFNSSAFVSRILAVLLIPSSPEAPALILSLGVDRALCYVLPSGGISSSFVRIEGEGHPGGFEEQ